MKVEGEGQEAIGAYRLTLTSHWLMQPGELAPAARLGAVALATSISRFPPSPAERPRT